MINKFKCIISRLQVAQINNKKVIFIKFSKIVKTILDLLWKEGFIYGYSNYQYKSFKIFLKYSKKGFSSLKGLVFYKKLIKRTELISLTLFEKNTTLFLVTNKGIFNSKNIIKKGLGGIILAKI